MWTLQLIRGVRAGPCRVGIKFRASPLIEALAMGSGTASVVDSDSMSLLDITGGHSGHGKGIPDRHGRQRRAVIHVFLAAWAVSFAALGGVIAPNTAVPSLPTPVMLLAIWVISSVTPTTGAVCVLGASAALGIGSQGLVRGIAFSMCSTAGYVAILVSAAVHPSMAWATRSSSSSTWANISWLLRLPSEFLMQVIWSLPRILTLPFRVPVALLLDVMAAEVCIVGHFILRFGEALGCGFGNGAAASDGDSAEDAGKMPVIFVHGLNSSRAIWLIGMLFLRARGLHLGPFIAMRYQAKEGDGVIELEATLREKVVSECECLGASRVILIGHSVGGILCAMIAESLGQEQQGPQVDSVVCISAPWRKRQPSSSDAVPKFSILSVSYAPRLSVAQPTQPRPIGWVNLSLWFVSVPVPVPISSHALLTCLCRPWQT